MKRNREPDIIQVIELLESGEYLRTVYARLKTLHIYIKAELNKCPQEIRDRYDVAVQKNLRKSRDMMHKRIGE